MRATKASPIFTEELAIIGQVPMVFYLPNTVEKADLTALITKYGGKVSDMHECFTYQIEPLQLEPHRSNYFQGEIYKAHWLVDSVKEGKLLPRSEYLSPNIPTKNCKRLDLP